jgi:hypothetical protein
MKRSALKPSSKPMKRGRMKISRPKTSKIRQSAKGEDCTICIPGVCNGRNETVVLCHSNDLSDGKGMGLKARDECAAYGCDACHAIVDGRAPRPDGMTYEQVNALFKAGIAWTQRILKLKGLI